MLRYLPALTMEITQFWSTNKRCKTRSNRRWKSNQAKHWWWIWSRSAPRMFHQMECTMLYPCLRRNAHNHLLSIRVPSTIWLARLCSQEDKSLGAKMSTSRRANNRNRSLPSGSQSSQFTRTLPIQLKDAGRHYLCLTNQDILASSAMGRGARATVWKTHWRSLRQRWVGRTTDRPAER